jgi:hypothetical protein
MTRIVIGNREMRIFDMARRLLNSSATSVAHLTDHVFELTLLDSPDGDSKEISVNAHAAPFSPLPYSALSDVISFFREAFGINEKKVTIEGAKHNILVYTDAFDRKSSFLSHIGGNNSEKSIELFGLKDREHFKEMLTSWGLEPGEGDFPMLRPLELMYFLLRVKLKQRESSDAAQTAPYPWVPGQWYRFESHTPWMFLGVRKDAPKDVLWWGRPSSCPDVSPKEYPQLDVRFHETAARLNWRHNSLNTCRASNIVPCEAFEEHRTSPPTVATDSEVSDWVPGQWYSRRHIRYGEIDVAMFLGKKAGGNPDLVYWGRIQRRHDTTPSEFPQLPVAQYSAASKLNWAGDDPRKYRDQYTIIPCAAPEGYRDVPDPVAPPVPEQPAVSENSVTEDWIPGQWYAAQQDEGDKPSPSVRMFLGRRTGIEETIVYWGIMNRAADIVISECPDVPQHLWPIAKRLHWIGNPREYYKSWHSIVPCPAPEGYESTSLPEPVSPKPPVQQDPYSVAVTLLSI